MYARQQQVTNKFELSGISIRALHELYDQTMGELERCAQYIPEDSSENEEVDLREAALLELERFMLDSAATMPLKDTQGIHSLIDLWGKVSGVNNADNLRPSDKIAMNIFRHLAWRLT